MEFFIGKENFLNGLSKIQGIVGRETTWPITRNVLITTGEDEISLVATDMETYFLGTYPARISVPGSITIPGKKLYEVVRDFPEIEVPVLETENGWVKIANKGLEYRLPALSAEEFPAVPALEREGLMSLNASDLHDLVVKSDLAAAGVGDDKRPYLVHLLGFYLSIYKDGESPAILRLVSTDGNRLCVVDHTPENPADLDGLAVEKGVVIPKKVIPEIKRISDGEGKIGVGIRKNEEGHALFVFSRESETLMGRLLEGEYPDYRAVIPGDVESSVSVDKKSFLPLLKRISIFTSSNFKAVNALISADFIRLSIKNPEVGESQEEYPVEFDGEPFETAFNPQFFIDALSAMKSEKVKIRLQKDKRAFLVTGDDDPGYLMVIMPMRN